MAEKIEHDEFDSSRREVRFIVQGERLGFRRAKELFRRKKIIWTKQRGLAHCGDNTPSSTA